MKVQIYNIDLKLLQRKQKQNNNLKKNLKQVLQISAFNHNLLSAAHRSVTGFRPATADKLFALR